MIKWSPQTSAYIIATVLSYVHNLGLILKFNQSQCYFVWIEIKIEKYVNEIMTQLA